MNKKEQEQLISFINEAKEDLSFDFGKYHRTHYGYVLGTKLIGYIKHLYEQQKVKVPPCVDGYINFCIGSEITLGEALTKEKLYTIGSFKFVDEALDWLESPINQDIFANAWLHGWEVEEEPKWVVKRKDNGKYVESLALGKGVGLIAETTASLQENAYKLNSKDQADAVAVLIDGTVEKV